MLMSWIWAGMVLLSVAAAALLGNGSELSGAVLDGAQSAVTLVVGMSGAICLWSGVGRVMEDSGITGLLSEILSPVLKRLFPDTRKDKVLSQHLSANICANILGLGNAATPMGILAAQRMAALGKPGIASNQLCRLVVLNTASIQLIPTSVAAIRLAAGASAPFDILPAVWLTSLCSAGVGLLAAWGMGKLWPDA